MPSPDMDPLLRSSWDRAWRSLQADGDGLAVRDALLARYAEAHRHYHTVQHLHECLGLFEMVSAAADHPAEVEIALWFHDAVYEVRSSDNENRSAAWAAEALRAAGVPSQVAARVHDLVLSTRHVAAPRTADECVLADIDLAILGAPEARFAEYERQIRQEYRHVPDLLFRLKRRAILTSLLERASIYHTPLLHRQLEARARANLAAALAASPP